MPHKIQRLSDCFFASVITLHIPAFAYPMDSRHKKNSSLSLINNNLNNVVYNGRQRSELLYVRVLGSAIPQQMMNDDSEHLLKDSTDKDVVNSQLQDFDFDFSEDEITLSTVTTLGVVMQWQPRVGSIKEVCLKTPFDYSIAATISNGSTTHDQYSYPLFNIWANQLQATDERSNNTRAQTTLEHKQQSSGNNP